MLYDWRHREFFVPFYKPYLDVAQQFAGSFMFSCMIYDVLIQNLGCVVAVSFWLKVLCFIRICWSMCHEKLKDVNFIIIYFTYELNSDRY